MRITYPYLLSSCYQLDLIDGTFTNRAAYFN
jgi:hypothetical protein